MPTYLTEQQKQELETLMDRTSVYSLLLAVAEICSLKAEHIAHSWQDASLARIWTRFGKQIESLALRHGPFGI